MSERTRDGILDAAQVMAQSRGFSGFSFRDLAAAVGIKAASIHYHFSTKEELGVALVARYTQRLLAALGDPADELPDILMARYLDAFRASLRDRGLMCLGGLFAAELDALPATVQEEVGRFIDANVAWLATVSRHSGDPANASQRARAIFAALEGAMLIARGRRDPALFDQIVESYTTTGVLNFPPLRGTTHTERTVQSSALRTASRRGA